MFCAQPQPLGTNQRNVSSSRPGGRVRTPFPTPATLRPDGRDAHAVGPHIIVSYSATMSQGTGSLEHCLLPLHHPVCFCLPSSLPTKQNHLWSQHELPKGCPSSPEQGQQGQWHNPLKPLRRVPKERMIWRMSLPAQRQGREPLTQRKKKRISPPGMKPRGESGARP